MQSLPFEVVPFVQHAVIARCLRLFLNLLFAAALIFLVRRRWLSPLLILNAIVLTIFGTYALSFHRPLMPVRLYYESREAWSLHSHVYNLISWQVLIVLLAGLLLKFWLLGRSGPSPLTPSLRLRALAFVGLAWAMAVFALQLTHSRLIANPSATRGRLVFIYGYTLPWISDLLVNRHLDAHVVSARAYQTNLYDRISPLEPQFSIPSHVVVLQLETVGSAAIHASYRGSPVMPFLRGLKDQGMYFRIHCFHSNGSCDMDYAATTCTETYPYVVPYRLPGLKFTNSMPEFIEPLGFQTYFFHGNSSIFYERGPAIQQMGFDHIFFEEQLAARKLPESGLGIRDAALFGSILDVLRPQVRAYVFAITLDTHAPFRALSPEEMHLFPRPASAVERYFNSLRHLDDCLRDFVQRLPKGTTLLLYGDHTASLNETLFSSDIVEGREFVGCILYQKGSDLSAAQRTRHLPISSDGSLNLLDVMNYLRHNVLLSPHPARIAGSL